MNKDMIYASTLNQIAKIITIETTYDPIYNRPINTEIEKEYKCRISRKSNSYPNVSNGSVMIIEQMRGYFEIDAEIKIGSIIEVDGIKYIAGLIYKPNYHHIEVDLKINYEA